MRIVEPHEIRTEEEQARLARVAEANRAEEARQRAARDARAAAERAQVAAVTDARGARLAAVAAKLVAKLRADEGLAKWVDPARITGPVEPLPPADVVNYRPSIEVAIGSPRGDGTGTLTVSVRAADARVPEHLLNIGADQVSSLISGRTLPTQDGPLVTAINGAGVGARLRGSVRADERIVVANPFDADSGERVPVIHGCFVRIETLSVAIGPDAVEATKPAKVWKDGWTSAGGRRAGIGAD